MPFMNNVAFPGMRVVVREDKEVYDTTSGYPTPGSTGTLVSRHRCVETRSRFGIDRYRSEPGVYEFDGSWVVKMDNPELGVTEFNGQPKGYQTAGYEFDVHPDSQEEYDRRYQELWVKPAHEDKAFELTALESVLNNTVRVRDLPTSFAWEQDEIIPKEGYERYFDSGEKCRLFVEEIEYPGLPSDFSEIVYRVSCRDNEGNHRYGTYIHESQVGDVIRGNVWKHENGHPLKFSSIEDEAAFHNGMGWAEETRNPKTDNYAWSIEEALDAVESGVVDLIRKSEVMAFFSDRIYITCLKFKDEDLGKRLREKTLKGFGRETPEAISPGM